jgi:hypothetical protein
MKKLVRLKFYGKKVGLNLQISKWFSFYLIKNEMLVISFRP